MESCQVSCQMTRWYEDLDPSCTEIHTATHVWSNNIIIWSVSHEDCRTQNIVKTLNNICNNQNSAVSQDDHGQQVLCITAYHSSNWKRAKHHKKESLLWCLAFLSWTNNRQQPSLSSNILITCNIYNCRLNFTLLWHYMNHVTSIITSHMTVW